VTTKITDYQQTHSTTYPNTVTQVSSSRSSTPIDSLQQYANIGCR